MLIFKDSKFFESVFTIIPGSVVILATMNILPIYGDQAQCPNIYILSSPSVNALLKHP